MKCSHCSVPDTLVGKTVTVKIYSEKLAILYNNDKVAVHERICSGAKRWSVKLEHYLTTLGRKPGALNASLALKQMPVKIQALFHKHFTDKARDFVFLLQYAKDHNFTHTDIVEAYDVLAKRGLKSVSADQIKTRMHAAGLDESIGDESICPGGHLQDESSQIEDGSMRILMDLSRIMDTGNSMNEVPTIN